MLPTKLPSHLCCCQWLPQHCGRLHHFKTKIPNTTVPSCPFQRRFLACLECLTIQMPYLLKPPLHCHGALMHSINQTQSKAIYLPSRGLITAWLTGLSNLCILAPRSSQLFFFSVLLYNKALFIKLVFNWVFEIERGMASRIYLHSFISIHLERERVSLLDHWALQSRARKYKTVFSFCSPINHAPCPEPSKAVSTALHSN